jgi:K+-sensing histidine kinase KdpD
MDNKLAVSDFTKVSKYSQLIQQSATNIYRLLINLLDWTRFQSAKIKVYPEWIEID